MLASQAAQSLKIQLKLSYLPFPIDVPTKDARYVHQIARNSQYGKAFPPVSCFVLTVVPPMVLALISPCSQLQMWRMWLWRRRKSKTYKLTGKDLNVL